MPKPSLVDVLMIVAIALALCALIAVRLRADEPDLCAPQVACSELTCRTADDCGGNCPCTFGVCREP